MVESLYSKLYNPQTIAKQHFVERFDGNDLDERWTTRDHSGTNTFEMEDEVDEGFTIITDGADESLGLIAFNLIRQFNMNSSHIIGIWKLSSTNENVQGAGVGLTDDNFVTQALNFEGAYIGGTINTGFWGVIADTGASQGLTNSSVTRDLNFHRFELDFNTSNLLGYIDGILETVTTAQIPSGGDKGQPIVMNWARTATVQTVNVRYVEVYNK